MASLNASFAAQKKNALGNIISTTSQKPIELSPVDFTSTTTIAFINPWATNILWNSWLNNSKSGLIFQGIAFAAI